MKKRKKVKKISCADAIKHIKVCKKCQYKLIHEQDE